MFCNNWTGAKLFLFEVFAAFLEQHMTPDAQSPPLCYFRLMYICACSAHDGYQCPALLSLLLFSPVNTLTYIFSSTMVNLTLPVQIK